MNGISGLKSEEQAAMQFAEREDSYDSMVGYMSFDRWKSLAIFFMLILKGTPLWIINFPYKIGVR